MPKTTKELLSDRLAEVRAELDKIEKESKPLREERAKLQESILPVEAKMRELQNAIRQIEQPRMGELRGELAALTHAMGTKSMKAAAAAVKGA